MSQFQQKTIMELFELMPKYDSYYSLNASLSVALDNHLNLVDALIPILTEFSDASYSMEFIARKDYKALLKARLPSADLDPLFATFDKTDTAFAQATLARELLVSIAFKLQDVDAVSYEITLEELTHIMDDEKMLRKQIPRSIFLNHLAKIVLSKIEGRMLPPTAIQDI